MALNHYFELGYNVSYWRTRKHQEVDFVLYGASGFLAIECKSSSRLRDADFESLQLFGEDYAEARRIMIYGGNEPRSLHGIEIVPARTFFATGESLLRGR